MLDNPVLYSQFPCLYNGAAAQSSFYSPVVHQNGKIIMLGRGQWAFLNNQELGWKYITGIRLEGHRETLRVRLSTEKNSLTIIFHPYLPSIGQGALCPCWVHRELDQCLVRAEGSHIWGLARNSWHPQQGDPPGQTAHSNPLSVYPISVLELQQK